MESKHQKVKYSTLYNKYGAKTFQGFGNDMRTVYAYNNLNQRLTDQHVDRMDIFMKRIANEQGTYGVVGWDSFDAPVLICWFNTGTLPELNPNADLKSTYRYDSLGNITNMKTEMLGFDTLNQVFTYDTASQLLTANETQNQRYQLNVTYNDYGRINTYNLSSQLVNTSDAFTYNTSFAPAFSTSNADTTFYDFGINGSLRRRKDAQKTEYYLFNGFGSMKAYSENAENFGYYGYDDAGQRTYKLALSVMESSTDEFSSSKSLMVDKMCLYPNGYININQSGEYTKHYYAESQRIASKIGSGSGVDIIVRDRYAMIVQDPKPGGPGNETFEPDEMQPFGMVYNPIGTSYLPIKSTKSPDMLRNLREVVIPNLDSLSVVFDQTTIKKLEGERGKEDLIFYYHGNHLSSTQMITDGYALVVQRLVNAPFGEQIKEYNVNWDERLPRYTYNAKEYDEENSMFYYEARYHKPPTFISRDPKFEEYPHLSPYHYCENNPINRIDPDGRNSNPVRSRIEYRGNGVFGVNINNLNKATRNNYYAATNDPKKWTKGEIGLNTTIARIQIQYNPAATKPDQPVGVDPSHTTTKTQGTRVAASTGQIDKREGHTINTIGGGAKTRGGGALMLALNAINLGYDMWNIFSINGDMNAISKQSNLLQQSFNVVQEAIASIDPKYQNTNDIGAITNFVFQGVNDTGNQDITKIGTDILKSIGRYDEKTKQIKPLIEE